jgi:shikimate dehydrogenase
MYPETFSLGLTGWPLTYSLSPVIHNAALNALHLPGEYCLHPVPLLPDGRAALLDLLERLRSGELAGLNVTIPHKQAVLDYLDDLTPLAKAVGAVNTLFRRGLRLVGDNTDVAGFLADLKRVAPALPLNRRQVSLRPAHALILGAGGAARAAAFGLAGLGWRVTIAARRIEQAVMLADDLRCSIMHGQADAVSLAMEQPELRSFLFDPSYCSENSRSRCSVPRCSVPATTTVFCTTVFCTSDEVARLQLIVNATPAGMASNQQENSWPGSLPLPEGVFVYDMVYVPSETDLVRRARAAGNPASNGAGMLVEQAAAAFEIWTGRAAPRGVMRQAIKAHNERIRDG